MSLFIKNIDTVNVSIDDLGITLVPNEEYDLTQDRPNAIANSTDLSAALTAGTISVLDPLDDVTPLSLAQAQLAISTMNDANFRIRGGELDQLDDVDASTKIDGYILHYDEATQTVAFESVRHVGGGVLGAGTWEYSAVTTAPPSMGQFRFNNADPSLATKFYIYYTNKNGNDLKSILSNIGAGRSIFAQEEDATDIGFAILFSGFTDQTTYGEFDISSYTAIGVSTVTAGKNCTIITTTHADIGLRLVHASATDTTPGTLDDKLSAGSGISLTLQNSGGDESYLITNTSPNVDQNIFETISADSGSTTASTTNDTLTLSGGNKITTSIVGSPAELQIDWDNANLEELSNVQMVGSPIGPSDKDLIWYNDTDQKWQNASIEDVFGVPPAPPGSELSVQLRWGPIPAVSGTTSITIQSNASPTITQGTQIWTDTLTPQNTSSTIRINTNVTVASSNASMEIVLVAFRGTTPVGMAVNTTANKDKGHILSFEIYDEPASTSQLTYSVRIGKNGGSGTWYANNLPNYTNAGNGILERNAYTIEEIGVVT